MDLQKIFKERDDDRNTIEASLIEEFGHKEVDWDGLVGEGGLTNYQTSLNEINNLYKKLAEEGQLA